MKSPKNVWIIFDPMDGPHIFRSEEQAKRTYRRWAKDAESCFDSFWDMSEPIKYER